MRVPTRKSERENIKPMDLHITQVKFNALKNKFERLKKSRPALANEVKRLAEMGDFSENAAYQIAKGKLRGLNNSMTKIDYLLKHAIIIKIQSNKNIVQVGHTVTVEVNGKQKNFQILGSAESNPLQGIISKNSPIGLALIDGRVGDVVKIKLKDKIVEYKIIKIV